MRYFHRTTLSPDEVLAQAKAFFGARLAPADESARRRTYAGALGKVTIVAGAEGGHYTRVEVSTDQVGESELDRLAKRFLGEVHKRAEPGHEATFAPYPAFAIAAISCSVVAASSLKSTSASPDVKSTTAEYTPFACFSACWTFC